ncbi:MAG: hypothetical protein A2653_01250 [Candidatus Zambryskibacteria bacterium RIFCSPHIGHO2_01_FULL_43_25]|uniref:Uncharacterized protein n=1 Tax=Candidatus Zambryskibacteria bacterium RIFCSPLOWO2_01_FULL_45_21 TaxID=1802761 RepID=A0A1G2U5Q9_9BACT|nr:MAG: hypothetical protein A2653_01250 [Candidatus Zambryskibacteria bacterium RIFCSPHIGHO2_01_FULL_43_25]OHB00417.1 MAG: hypothetical protein A3E94_01790 [Candidatus Zambryskibacteria bacterium RIFCSPHIGHO2_12_FULL_44_12b]OHB04212.1 MAG: hypothetical protein A3B14_02265 [Candidatus Zambryskibacteria bacterium RIFCSPLOWO2_01_FULL_45_21]
MKKKLEIKAGLYKHSKSGKLYRVDELDREYEARNLRPDPYAVTQVMADDPAFADKRPVAVQWRDKRGCACYALFDRDDAGREVGIVRRRGSGSRWSRSVQFGGVRLPAQAGK